MCEREILEEEKNLTRFVAGFPIERWNIMAKWLDKDNTCLIGTVKMKIEILKYEKYMSEKKKNLRKMKKKNIK